MGTIIGASIRGKGAGGSASDMATRAIASRGRGSSVRIQPAMRAVPRPLKNGASNWSSVFQLRAAGGGEHGYGLEVGMFQRHGDQVFGREGQPAGPVRQLESRAADAVVRAIHHLGTDQPIGAGERAR